MLIWKYDGELRKTSAPFGPDASKANDPNGDITINGNFSTSDPDGYTGTTANTNCSMSYLRLEGTGLNTLVATTSVKLRHDVNTTELLHGRVVVNSTTSASVRFGTVNGTGAPPVYPSLGQYDLEINGTIVLDKAVTLVGNLLDDKTFRLHATGAQLSVFFNGITELLLSPYWRTLQPYPDTDGVRRGSANIQ
jgi:hypothetical protein